MVRETTHKNQITYNTVTARQSVSETVIQSIVIFKEHITIEYSGFRGKNMRWVLKHAKTFWEEEEIYCRQTREIDKVKCLRKHLHLCVVSLFSYTLPLFLKTSSGPSLSANDHASFKRSNKPSDMTYLGFPSPNVISLAHLFLSFPILVWNWVEFLFLSEADLFRRALDSVLHSTQVTCFISCLLSCFFNFFPLMEPFFLRHSDAIFSYLKKHESKPKSKCPHSFPI